MSRVQNHCEVYSVYRRLQTFKKYFIFPFFCDTYPSFRSPPHPRLSPAVIFVQNLVLNWNFLGWSSVSIWTNIQRLSSRFLWYLSKRNVVFVDREVPRHAALWWLSESLSLPLLSQLSSLWSRNIMSPNSFKVSRGIPWSQRKCGVGTQIPRWSAW
jgi:hypothetical protein